jgi:hypothetical protein
MSPEPGSRTTVRQIAVPASARGVGTLSRIDYADAFLVDVAATQRHTGEQWARLVLEDAAAATRRSLVSGWSAIGLRVRRGRSDDHVLGWQIRQSTPDHVLLGADSRIGLPGELLFQRRADGLLFCTFVHLANPVARTVWAGVTPIHVRTVRNLLEQAGQRSSP